MLSVVQFERFVSDETGATAIEYALVGSIFAITTLGAFSAFSDALGDMWTNWTDEANSVLS
ncbi:MAG: Flp family type IVb pilin [Pseudomonadota bacterium]